MSYGEKFLAEDLHALAKRMCTARCLNVWEYFLIWAFFIWFGDMISYKLPHKIAALSEHGRKCCHTRCIWWRCHVHTKRASWPCWGCSSRTYCELCCVCARFISWRYHMDVRCFLVPCWDCSSRACCEWFHIAVPAWSDGERQVDVCTGFSKAVRRELVASNVMLLCLLDLMKLWCRYMHWPQWGWNRELAASDVMLLCLLDLMKVSSRCVYWPQWGCPSWACCENFSPAIFAPLHEGVVLISWPCQGWSLWSFCE